MTSYPVNYVYDRSEGSLFDGMAATAEEARAIIDAIASEAEGAPVTAQPPRLATTEAGQIATSRAQVEDWWADEIAEGWVAPVQVWGGWKAEVTYWAV